jgi:hypothetical protein
VQASIQIVRTFIHLRKMLSSSAELFRKVAALERTYDAQFQAVFEAIRKLMAPPKSRKQKRIGFRLE